MVSDTGDFLRKEPNGSIAGMRSPARGCVVVHQAAEAQSPDWVSSGQAARMENTPLWVVECMANGISLSFMALPAFRNVSQRFQTLPHSIQDHSSIGQAIAAWAAAHKLSQFLLPVLICLSVITVRGAERQAADYVFKNGAIYTMDANAPKAQAVAVTGKEISYVGDDKGAEACVGDNTKVIDLNGSMLLPGFVESHIHPTLAVFAAGADLQTDSLDEVLARTKAWADSHPDAPIIRGFGWRYNVFPPTGPNKADLDKLFPDRPVVLFAIDGHSAWVNSKALAMAGITAETPDPAPGFSWFERDPKTNEPSGWLVEVPAVQAVFFKLQTPSPENVIAAMVEQLAKFSAAGITAAWDAGIPLMPTERGLEAYQDLEKENKLPLRIVGSYYWNNPAADDPVGTVLRLREKHHSELVQAKALKINVDGGDFQHTTVLIKPYADRPGYRGEYLLDPKLINAAVLKAQANGVDTHAHTLGDGAVRAYLDAVEAARKAYPDSPSRHTASHCQYMSDDEIERMAKLNVTYQASAQWNTPDPGVEMSIKIIGKDVMFTEYGRINSVLKAGGRVAFGTDWPAANYVSTYRPLDAIQVALTRAILPQFGTKQFMPVLPPENERITLDQALKASTLDAA